MYWKQLLQIISWYLHYLSYIIYLWGFHGSGGNKCQQNVCFTCHDKEVKRRWELTDHPLRAPPHPDDVLRDRQVVRSTYPLNGVQETENLMIIPTSQYLAATLTWRVIKNYLYEKMNTHYLAETLIGWVVENSARRLNVSFILSSSSHRRLMFMLVTDHDENEE